MTETELNPKNVMTAFLNHYGITSEFINTETVDNRILYRLVLKSKNKEELKIWLSKSSQRNKYTHCDEIYVTVSENEKFNEEKAYELMMSYISNKGYDEILSSYDKNIEPNIMALIPSFSSIYEFKIKTDLMGVNQG